MDLLYKIEGFFLRGFVVKIEGDINFLVTFFLVRFNFKVISHIKFKVISNFGVIEFLKEFPIYPKG